MVTIIAEILFYDKKKFINSLFLLCNVKVLKSDFGLLPLYILPLFYKIIFFALYNFIFFLVGSSPNQTPYCALRRSLDVHVPVALVYLKLQNLHRLSF